MEWSASKGGHRGPRNGKVRPAGRGRARGSIVGARTRRQKQSVSPGRRPFGSRRLGAKTLPDGGEAASQNFIRIVVGACCLHPRSTTAAVPRGGREEARKSEHRIGGPTEASGFQIGPIS